MICACYRHTNKVVVIHSYQLYGVRLEGFHSWQRVFFLYLYPFVPDGAEKDCIEIPYLLCGDCGHTAALRLPSPGHRNYFVDLHIVYPGDDTRGTLCLNLYRYNESQRIDCGYVLAKNTSEHYHYIRYGATLAFLIIWLSRNHQKKLFEKQVDAKLAASDQVQEYLEGIANQLNLQGIRKIPRQNGTLEDWTGHFIKLILDNPVYCGKIAYGRRTKEKVKGTKNDYQMKRNDDYILTEGQHKGIVSEEVWEKAHAKRLRTGVKQPSKIGRDRVHLLSGLLKCPVCGSPMYTNKHAWTNKDGTYKEIYYYVCSRNRMVRGKHCEYKAMLKKTDIEPMVIEAIREIVRNEEYAQAIKKRIGVQIDTKAVDKELEGYQAKLKEVDLNKTRLEREIDSLPADAKYRERKLHDMTLRLDSLYDVIVELEEKIEDARLRRDAIKQQAITLENIYKIMVNFDCVYNIINDEEKRNVVTALIKEIEIYRNDESEYPLKRIGLNFPVFKDGGEVTELLWDKGNTVECVVKMVHG